MMGKSHLVTGVTASVWTAYALPVEPGMAVMVAVVGAFYALAPDLDHVSSRASLATPDARYLSQFVRSFGTHRTVTHDPRLGPPVFAGVTALGVAFVHGPIGTHWWAFGIAALVGCLTHLWGDARTLTGIPFGRRRITIGRTFRTGSDRELRLRTLIYQPVAVVSVVATIWLSLP